MHPSIRRQTIADALRRSALRLPAKTAIICGPTTWTYGEFDALVSRLAAGLAQRGVQAQVQARHFILCEACDRQGRPGEMPWQAVVEWNRAFPDTRRTMAEFPFFVLDGLSLREARSKLVGVRADLETRRARAKLKARAGQEVGKRFSARRGHLMTAPIAAATAGAAEAADAAQAVNDRSGNAP